MHQHTPPPATEHPPDTPHAVSTHLIVVVVPLVHLPLPALQQRPGVLLRPNHHISPVRRQPILRTTNHRAHRISTPHQGTSSTPHLRPLASTRARPSHPTPTHLIIDDNAPRVGGRLPAPWRGLGIRHSPAASPLRRREVRGFVRVLHGPLHKGLLQSVNDAQSATGHDTPMARLSADGPNRAWRC